MRVTDHLGAAWRSAMLRGDFESAWALNDAYLERHDIVPADDPRLPYHLRRVWDGCRPEGRDVLVRCYHGLGDTLQFVRYLLALRQRVASLTLEVQAPLVPLLREFPAVDRLVAFDPAAPLPPSPCDLEIMELAHALRIHPAALPPPYLHAAPAALPAAAGLVIGLCWQSGDWDLRRSVPLDMLAPAVSAPRRRFVRLHPDNACAPLTFINASERLGSILTTAGLVAACDVVVSVDTMVAHLAGAMGRPVLLLLRRDADWRWGTGERCAWYPRTLLLRQEVEGEWSAPLAALRRLLDSSEVSRAAD